MKELKIFIASSSDLKKERDSLAKCIHSLSDQYYGYDLHLEPVEWEFESREFYEDRKQNEYNEKLISSDIAIFIFSSKIGKFTKEEFYIAVNEHKNGRKLKHIITYFKNALINTCDLNTRCIEELQEVMEMKKHFENELKQVYKIINSTEELMLSVIDEINRVARPLIAQHSNANCDSNLIEYIDLYTSIDYHRDLDAKTNIIKSGIMDLILLRNFDISPGTRVLSKMEFYEYCKKILNVTQTGGSIKALSMMLKCEWTNTQDEQEFWKLNLSSVKRGTSLERIFIVKKSEAHRLQSTPQIVNHVAYGNNQLKSYIIEEEILLRDYSDLLHEAGKGFLLIKDSKASVALLDSDLGDNMDGNGRGTPCIDETRLDKLEALFNQIRDLATPLKEYLKAIPLSHYKKEMLSIFLTTKCNLNCDYCFTNKNTSKHKSQTISLDFVKYGIDEYFQTDYMRHIRFFGAGEPTEEFLLLKDIHRYAKEHGGEYVTFEIQTNGAFSPNIAKWLAENIQIVWISCDGTPEIQDAHRPFLSDGRKTSAIIERNIKSIIEIKGGLGNVGIRATITKENVNCQIEMIKYFKGMGVNSIWVDPIFPSVGTSVNLIENELDIMNFAEKFLDACKYAEKNNVFYGSILTCNFADKVTKHCRACLPVPHLTTDGFVSACDMALFGKDENHMSPLIYGKWNEAEKRIQYEGEKIETLRSRNIDDDNMNKCNNCISREHCGGYCLGEVLNETGSLFGQKAKVCEAIRFLDENLSPSMRTYLYTHP